jgi:hypothetical protein
MSTSPAQHGPDACPSPEELLDFSAGRSAATAREAIARHIEAPCPRCEAALLGLDERKDSLIADLQAAHPLSSSDAEEACLWALARVPSACPASCLPTTEEGVGARSGPVDVDGKQLPQWSPANR